MAGNKKKTNRKLLAVLTIPIGILLSLTCLLSPVNAVGYEYIVNTDFSNPGSLAQFTITKDDAGKPDPYLPSTYAYLYGDTAIAIDSGNKMLNTDFTFNLDFQIRGDWPIDPANKKGSALLYYITQNEPIQSDGTAPTFAPYITLERSVTNGTYTLISRIGTTNHYVYELTHHLWYYLTVTVNYDESTDTQTMSVYLVSPATVETWTVWNTTAFTWNDESKDHWFNFGPFGYGATPECGAMYLDNIIIQYYNTTGAPTTPLDNGDPSIDAIIYQLVFFLPAIILTTFIGRLGIIGGIGIMTIVYMVGMPGFLWCGIMLIATMGVYVYRGGLS